MKDFEVVLRRLRTYALAVTFSDNPFTPYPIHQGHVVMLEPNSITVITKENYEEIVTKLFDKICIPLRKSSDPLMSLFVYISSPYALPFLNMILDQVDQKEVSELLGFIWRHTEFPHQNNVRMLVNLFKLADPKVLMSAEDYQKFQSFPDELVVYRGLQSSKAKVRGLSWTLSLEKAQWFANRWKKSGGVYEATVSPHHRFAYFSGMGEEEIIVNPVGLKNINERK